MKPHSFLLPKARINEFLNSRPPIIRKDHSGRNYTDEQAYGGDTLRVRGRIDPDDILSIPVTEITLAFAENKDVFIITRDKHRYKVIDGYKRLVGSGMSVSSLFKAKILSDDIFMEPYVGRAVRISDITGYTDENKLGYYLIVGDHFAVPYRKDLYEKISGDYCKSLPVKDSISDYELLKSRKKPSKPVKTKQ